MAVTADDISNNFIASQNCYCNRLDVVKYSYYCHEITGNIQLDFRFNSIHIVFFYSIFKQVLRDNISHEFNAESYISEALS